MNDTLPIDTPEWAEPLLTHARYKGAYGGRGSGKSHFFAELGVEALVINPDARGVCIREVQKSLKYSAKTLIEDKIQSLGVESLFDITQSEIRSVKGTGVIIFQGMQDHTAESIKSLEGFDWAWVEEAQSLSKKSLKLLRPTIRKEGSEIWFSWNPDQPEDPVDDFLRNDPPEDSVVVNVNYPDNPFFPEILKREVASDMKRMDQADFEHVWLGGYNKKSDAIIFSGKWHMEEFEPGNDWHGPYQGIDFGFANDPTTANRVWVNNNTLYIEYEAGRTQLELDDTATFINSRIPDFERYISRADSARPESISYLKRHGMPKIKGVKKWQGSVEDGIEHMKSYDKIVVHPRCKSTAQELRLYSYKVDKRSGDIQPKIEDKNNHHIDGIRYALTPMIKKRADFEVLAF